MKLKKGFTLIELMIVVVIIGLLAALAVPMYRSATIKAKRSEAKIELKRIWEALEEYKLDNGGIPLEWDGWVLYDAGCPMWNSNINDCWDIPEGLSLSPMSGKPRFTYVIHLGECPYDANFYTLGPFRYVLPSVVWAFSAVWGGDEPGDDDEYEEVEQYYWISAEPFDSWDASLRDTDPVILDQNGNIFQVPASDYGGGEFPADAPM